MLQEEEQVQCSHGVEDTSSTGPLQKSPLQQTHKHPSSSWWLEYQFLGILSPILLRVLGSFVTYPSCGGKGPLEVPAEILLERQALLGWEVGVRSASNCHSVPGKTLPGDCLSLFGLS